MKHTDQNILDIMAYLKMSGKIRFEAEFCRDIGLLKQNLVNIKKGNQYFTPDHIKAICEVYRINANWIFGLSSELFTNGEKIVFTDIAQPNNKKAALIKS